MWNNTLKAKSSRYKQVKIEYLKYNFNIQGFQNLGSIIQYDGELLENNINRIKDLRQVG